MRRNLFIAAWLPLALTGASLSAHAANVSDFFDFSLTSGATTLLPGRLYVPPEAVSNPGTKRPLILFLHGGGEQGTNNTAQVNGNIDNLLAEAKRRGAYLYAPQSTSTWASATLTANIKTMIDRAIGQLSIDANRLYVTGLSNGGGGTWNMLSRFPDTFAAGVPICGIAPSSDFVASRLIDQHIAAFHARNDPVVSYTVSRSVVPSILSAAHRPLPAYPSPRDTTSTFLYEGDQIDLYYLEFPTGGHGIWPVVYGEPQLYDWLFDQSLVPEPSALSLAGAVIPALIAVGRRRNRV
jgi:predicted peptidase